MKVWEAIERPRLRDWQAGLEIDLGAEGKRLRRYEAAADRLFRSAWRELEGLREGRGEPLMPRSEPELPPEPAARSEPTAIPPPTSIPTAPAPRQAAVRTQSAVPSLSLRDDPPTALDFRVGGPPRPGVNQGILFQDKTNPTPSRPASRGRAAGRRSFPSEPRGRDRRSVIPGHDQHTRRTSSKLFDRRGLGLVERMVKCDSCGQGL